MSEQTEATIDAATPEPAGFPFYRAPQITAKELATTLGFLRKELGAVHSFTGEEIQSPLNQAFHYIVGGQITHQETDTPEQS